MIELETSGLSVLYATFGSSCAVTSSPPPVHHNIFRVLNSPDSNELQSLMFNHHPRYPSRYSLHLTFDGIVGLFLGLQIELSLVLIDYLSKNCYRLVDYLSNSSDNQTTPNPTI